MQNGIKKGMQGSILASEISISSCNRKVKREPARHLSATRTHVDEEARRDVEREFEAD